VKYMIQATSSVLTPSFKIVPSLFPSVKEFKDEKTPDVLTFRIKVSVHYTHLFTEQMAEYSVALEAISSASKFRRISKNVAQLIGKRN